MLRLKQNESNCLLNMRQMYGKIDSYKIAKRINRKEKIKWK